MTAATQQPEALAGTEVLCTCGNRPKPQCPGEWEPGCDLGNNEAFAVAVDADPSLDDKAGLVSISIRLPRGLIEKLKEIAPEYGIGYQTLARVALVSFIQREKNRGLG